jgi:hypothetical protein
LGDAGNLGVAFRIAFINCRLSDIATSGLAVAILRFGYRSTSTDVGDDFESGDPENPSIAVGTACLSFVEREILRYPVWRPSFCTFGVSRYRDLIDYVPYILDGKLYYENVGISLKFRLATNICSGSSLN